MYKWIAKLDRGLESIERFAAVGLYTLLIGLICINILTRNILHWTSDALLALSPTVVLWLCLVGATLALKYHRHIKIELLLRFLPPAARRLAISLTRLFAMVICGSLAWASVIFVYGEINLSGQRGWLAICFPLFFSVAFFRFGCDLLRQWGHRESEEP
jgi:TRAP-type C4-dicarboxylate transport system permease small subunit